MVPALPEDDTQGDSRERAIAKAREAIKPVIVHGPARGRPRTAKSSDAIEALKGGR